MKKKPESSTETSPSLNRRSFLAGSAAVAAFTVVPRHVLGGPGYLLPNEKLNIAGIGIGGKGFGDLKDSSSENIVALCDVDKRKGKRAFENWPQAKQYQDYRVMLDREKDIDAVIVATPDHTHAVASMAAIKRGKHVYTQKPLTHTVQEARLLAAAARKYKVATQMGNQGQAGSAPRRLREVIWDGVIGPVREVHVWTDRPNRGLVGEYWPQGVDRPQDTPSVPEYLDWDVFLGPAPVRPYHPAYHPFKWRGWWDFGTGALGDIGCHSLDPVFRALKLGHPLNVEAMSSRVNKETYPQASIVRYEFPARKPNELPQPGDDFFDVSSTGLEPPKVEMPPVTVTWYDGGLRPPRPKQLDDGLSMGTNGTLYVGDEGLILNNMILPAERRKAYKSPDAYIPNSIGQYKEWIEACKGGTPAGSNFEWAGPLTEVVLLGNVPLRMELREQVNRQKLRWDPKGFAFTNIAEANPFLTKSYREGWTM